MNLLTLGRRKVYGLSCRRLRHDDDHVRLVAATKIRITLRVLGLIERELIQVALFVEHDGTDGLHVIVVSPLVVEFSLFLLGEGHTLHIAYLIDYLGTVLLLDGHYLCCLLRHSAAHSGEAQEKCCYGLSHFITNLVVTLSATLTM